LSLSTNPDFIGLIESSRARYPAGTGIPIEVVRRRLGLDRPGPGEETPASTPVSFG
jgi:hypothetical protein